MVAPLWVRSDGVVIVGLCSNVDQYSVASWLGERKVGEEGRCDVSEKAVVASSLSRWRTRCRTRASTPRMRRDIMCPLTFSASSGLCWWCVET